MPTPIPIPTGPGTRLDLPLVCHPGLYLKGFLYPFLSYSVKSASDAPPEGHSSAAAQSILAAFEDADIPEEKKVDLIAIQLEAYNDFTKFGVPDLNPAVYEEFHKLEAEGYTGNLVTNIFAGGTVDTERCFLTRYSRLGSFRTPHKFLRLVSAKAGVLHRGEPLLLCVVLQPGEYQRQPGASELLLCGELLRRADRRRRGL